MTPLGQRLKRILRYHLCPLLLRHPRLGLEVPRFHRYLTALADTCGVDGAIVEVGAAYLGTTALAHRFLTKIENPTRRYVVIDTFQGFVEEQFKSDPVVSHQLRHAFTSNSLRIAQRLRRQYGIDDVTLVQGDIAQVPDSALPDRISVALIDVDLAAPVEIALRRLWPRIVPGGVALVDDCDPKGEYAGALVGFERFTRDMTVEIHHGLGVIAKSS